MLMRPIDIATKLGISTSALRNYEAQGIVPPAERSAGGYRIYTEEHLAYFECIQAMAPGFGMEATKEVLRKIQSQEVDLALRVVNKIQANLHRDLLQAEKSIQCLASNEPTTHDVSPNNEWMTIGEVSAATNIPSSTIRYWEKIGLISSSRNQQNGYRLFNSSQRRKIILLRTLRPAVYSFDLVELKQSIGVLDYNDVEHAINIARDSLAYLNNVNQQLLRGTYYLYRLCRLLNLLD